MVGEYINVEQRRLDKKYGILHSEGDEDNGQKYLATKPDKLDSKWFNLAIFKPDIEYIIDSSHIDREQFALAEGQRLSIQSSTRISNDQELNRVVSRSFYGKWYMPTEKWSSLQSEAVVDHVKDGLAASRELDKDKRQLSKGPLREKPAIMGQQVQPNQVDWNRQANFSLKRSIHKKETILAKMLSQMSKDQVKSDVRAKIQQEYADRLREKSNQLLDSNYLSQVIKFVPGVAEAYFYELRKVVEHQGEAATVLDKAAFHEEPI